MKIIFLATSLLLTVMVSAQVIRDHRRPTGEVKPVTTTKPVNTSKPVSGNQVSFYEHASYSGASRSFAIGNHRLMGATDFNDMYSSIKVPPGMGVYIYEHADEKGGYGLVTDILEDVPDLSVYNLNDKVSYISVFATSNPSGMVWVRGRMRDGQFVSGHWERKRADGTLPNNAPPATVSEIASRTIPFDDIAHAPLASQAELDEFNDILTNQMGVAVLGGETTKPFYYHHNQEGEQVYKYNKLIDPAYLPGAFFDWLGEKMGRLGFVVKPVEVVTDVANDIKDWFLGSSSTKMQMDCWYPVTEFKQTVCGKMKEVFLCPQNYLHTKVTVDKDVCYSLTPSPRFSFILTNRWTGQTHEGIEGEVTPALLANYNTSTGKSTETTTPKNPLFMQLAENEDVCFFGPWMGDVLNLNFKVPIPLTSTSVDLGNLDLRKANEIHPMNQIWKKKGNETQLIAVVDKTGYFQKIGNGEIAASGLYQKMRFYYAFQLPAKTTVINSGNRVYDINGIGFDFTGNPPNEVSAERITLKHNGLERIVVNDNSFLRTQRTHRVFFDKVRKRADGSIQGFIVIETEPITKQGGSINIFVKDNTVDTSPAGPMRPVRTQ